jgi:hypothetical protein
MKRFGSRHATKYAALLLALAVVAVVVVASAQAAPLKKKFDAYVVATDSSSTSFTVTLENDPSSQQTLGSADFSTSPGGPSVAPIPLTNFTTADGHHWSVCTGSGGSLCGDGANNVVEFRSATSGDALLAGQSVSVTVPADKTGCTNATWLASAKQSNDYSGTNNIFNLAANDLTPLGSFTTDPIASIIDRSVTPTVTFTAHALDTCGNPKTDYTGAAPTPYQQKLTYTGLTNATPAASTGLSWSNGNGSITVTPAASEAGNQFTIADQTTGITTSSSTFAILDEVCTKTNGKPCSVNDGQYQKNGVATTVLSGANPTGTGQFLGLGFDPSVNDTCSAGTKEYGAKMLIEPSSDLGLYQVTITYTKAAGKGTPSSVFICFQSPNSGGWQVLANCSKTVGPPCIASSSGTSNGGLQFVLSLDPTDPTPIGHQ